MLTGRLLYGRRRIYGLSGARSLLPSTSQPGAFSFYADEGMGGAVIDFCTKSFRLIIVCNEILICEQCVEYLNFEVLINI